MWGKLKGNFDFTKTTDRLLLGVAESEQKKLISHLQSDFALFAYCDPAY